ncbi:MAG: DNA primase [Spartobacteria bacterium]|nr:DNA primase [Spartobacteria bacterium]
MGKMLSKQVIEDIRSRNDITEVIGAYIRLKRAGSAFKALCPFHKEKTPSFQVNPHKQIFHCFGCGKGGDVFSFLMEYEGMSFIEAAKVLAERAGMNIEWEDADSRAAGRTDKNRLYQVHEEVVQFYRERLKSAPAAEPARAYLKDRQLDGEIGDTFQFGYAPDEWDALITWGRKKGFSIELLDELGLVIKSEKGDKTHYYDRFRKRIMIPIRDELGRPIAFTGRVLSADQHGGKYVNSPETILFSKSRALFAVDKARRAIVDERRAIVCEGQIDAIRCHQAGLITVVASQGTALTGQHAHLLKRYADEVVLMLDADKAGEDAALRGAHVLMDAGLSVLIAQLPTGEDPDTMLLNQGKDAFLALVDNAQSVVEFQLNILAAREDLSTEAGVMRAERAVLETIQHAQSALLRDRFVQQVSERLGVRENALRVDLKSQADHRPSTRETQPLPPRQSPATRKTRHPHDELALVELLLAHPGIAPLVETYLTPYDLTDPLCRKMTLLLIEHQDDPGFRLLDHLDAGDQVSNSLITHLEMAPSRVLADEIPPERAAQDLILCLRRNSLERERAHLRSVMQAVEPAEQSELQIRSFELTHQLAALRQGWSAAVPFLENPDRSE